MKGLIDCIVNVMLLLFCLLQSLSVTLGVRSLHDGERDASRPLLDLRAAATRYSCVHCSRKPGVSADVTQHRVAV